MFQIFNVENADLDQRENANLDSGHFGYFDSDIQPDSLYSAYCLEVSDVDPDSFGSVNSDPDPEILSFFCRKLYFLELFS